MLLKKVLEPILSFSTKIISIVSVYYLSSFLKERDSLISKYLLSITKS
jgi:hypothetical protein